jgi:hypothetical protein
MNITLDGKDLAASPRIIIDLQKLYSIVKDLSYEVDNMITDYRNGVGSLRQ